MRQSAGLGKGSRASGTASGSSWLDSERATVPRALSATTRHASPGHALVHQTRRGKDRVKASDAPIADALAGARNGRIKAGIGGWNFAPWRDNFYPKGLPQRRELEYASRHLATLEINSTFYRAQTPKVYAKWRDETPPGFVFSLKAPRQVAEGRKLAGAGALVRGFLFGGLAEFGDRLGPIVWQFPPSRAFDRDDFAAFLDLLPRELNGRALRHVLEMRHASFLCPGFLALARGHGLPCVFTDSGEYPNFADLTGDFVYARLMRSRGSEHDGYPASELDTWAARARLWSEGGEPDDLPRVAPADATRAATRDVFIHFISAAKQRNPAAAMALQGRVA
ncbi:MAG: DUF72 domain-containing protein [Rhodanobacteraceae bacterium]|nr:MAG: DUF72 domain-containing protein [Rhodanobacteraceae bacterium]